MTKKSKKLGVKIQKSEVSSDATVEQIEENEIDDSKSGDEAKDDIPGDGKQNAISQNNIIAENLELKTVCNLLDKLTLEMLILMEKLIQEKLKIETTMTAGETHLVKSRFIMGHKNVSALQLPTENSNDIEPAVTVLEIDNDETYLGKPKLKLNVKEYSKTPVEEESKNKNIRDPIHWFGMLVPRNLHLAQSSFRTAIEHVVDCANTQTRLNQVCIKIKQLREIKIKLSAID